MGGNASRILRSRPLPHRVCVKIVRIDRSLWSRLRNTLNLLERRNRAVTRGSG
jgi:hypothetical protein